MNIKNFIIKIIISIKSSIKINFLILVNLINGKKTILLYHPGKDIFGINYYFKSIIGKESNLNLLILTRNYKRNYNNEYFILDKFLITIFYCKFFITNNVTDNFPIYSKNIYIHHDIYDTPLTSKKNELNLKKRLMKYDAIFVSNTNSKKNFQRLLSNSQIKIIIIGYLKLDYLKDKYQVTKLNNLIIATTDFKSFYQLSSINYLEKMINFLLKNTNYRIHYRPHPSNQEDKEVKNIIKKFKYRKNFFFNKDKNYAKLYTKSKLMISDMSGTAYTYAFLTYNPVIFFSPNENLLRKLNYNKLNFFKNRNKIGKVYKNIGMFKNLKTDSEKNYKIRIMKLIKQDGLNHNNSSKKFLNELKNF